MKKILLIVLIFGVLVSCNSKKELKTPAVNYTTIEEQALKYFIDSLLYQDHIFSFEKETYDSANIVLPPSIYYDSLMYLKGGLFAGFDVYSDSLVLGLSEPFMDSIQLEYATDALKQEQYVYQKNYDSMVYDLQGSIVNLPKLIKPISQEKIEVLRPKRSIFLEIRQALPGVKSNHSLVQLEITRYYSTTHDSYNLYFIMEEGRVVNWFFN